tara:strand:+ start:177 stop:758 length:582 start_codon:yes stop_codon:yes gene_type:complete
MKKTIVYLLFFILFFTTSSGTTEVKLISEGNKDAKIRLVLYESLTCSHCANFHNKIYPKLKEDFIDKGLVKIEFKNFPLDMAAFNASKIAHCKNNGNSEVLHFLYQNQTKWVKGDTIEKINSHLKNLIETSNFQLNFEQCLDNKKIEDHVLEDRVEGVKKFKINSTPTLIINNKKFDKPLNYKNLKKTLEKLI